MREGRQRPTLDRLQLGVPTALLGEGRGTHGIDLVEGRLRGDPGQLGDCYPSHQVEQVVLLGGQDADAEEDPLYPEHDDEDVPCTGPLGPPRGPDCHQAS